MSVPGKTIARVFALGVLVAAATLLNTKTAEAATCRQICMEKELACAAACGDTFNICVSNCVSAELACFKACN